MHGVAMEGWVTQGGAQMGVGSSDLYPKARTYPSIPPSMYALGYTVCKCWPSFCGTLVFDNPAVCRDAARDGQPPQCAWMRSGLRHERLGHIHHASLMQCHPCIHP